MQQTRSEFKRIAFLGQMGKRRLAEKEGKKGREREAKDYIEKQAWRNHWSAGMHIRGVQVCIPRIRESNMGSVWVSSKCTDQRKG